MRLVKGLLERCVEVVELLSAAGAPMRLSDIAQALDLPKGAAHRLLQELCALGWAEQDGSGLYRLALRFALLGNRVLQASGLSDLTQPVLDRLAARTRELVRLTVATGDGLVWLGSAQGALPGLMYQPAMNGTLVLHATANGKAFLATLDDSAALLLARRGGFGAVRPTPQTMRDEAALLADLARVRMRGYGLAEQEAELGVNAVAVAILGPAVVALGSVSVAGPSLRLPPARIPELASALRETAAVLASIWPTRAIQGKAIRS
jgi:DNA-binding IclR family transcriptional regulator